jgi:hypothetical protein
MTPHEVLVGADLVLSDESKWTKRALAINNTGENVFPEAVDACKWCLIGAVQCVMFRAGPVFDEPHVVMDRANDALKAAIHSKLVVCFNDDDATKFADVKRALAVAIEATK